MRLSNNRIAGGDTKRNLLTTILFFTTLLMLGFRQRSEAIGVYPNFGPTTGGSSITIVGIDFQSGDTVKIGGVDATGVTFVSSNRIDVVTPAGAAGAKDVTVTNPDSESTTSIGGFNYVTPWSGDCFKKVGVLPLYPGDGFLSTPVLDSVNGYAYFSMYYSDPGQIIKVRLSDFSLVDTLTLNSEESRLYQAIFDPVNGYAYFGVASFGSNSTHPRSIVKIRLSDFSRVGSLTLDTQNDVASSVIDPINGYAYFGVNESLPKIIKVRLSDMTQVDSITLNSGEFVPTAVIDPTHGYAYFGTYSQPGTIIKIRLSDFTRVDTITLNTGEDYLFSSVIDSPKGYAYFGTETNPGRVVKVRLSDFKREDSITLNSGDSGLYWADIDSINGIAYFGTDNTNPGTIVKIRLSDFTRAGSLMLNAGEPGPVVPIVDPIGGYAYVGTFASNGEIIKIDISPINCPPTITSVAPSAGSTAGESNVTINGTHFENASVTFDGTAAVVISQDANAIQVQTPPHAAGPVDVVVTNADGQSDSLLGAFTYGASLPNITAVLPNYGPMAGGSIISLIGSDFQNGATVEIDGVKAASVTYVNHSRLDAVTPAGMAGVKDVTITNPDTRSTSTVGGFHYFPPWSGDCFKRVAGTTFNNGVGYLEPAFLDPIEGYGVFAFYNSRPGFIIKVRLSDLAVQNYLMLDYSEYQLEGGLFDPIHGNAYFWTVGAKIIKIRMSDFTEVASLTLNSGETHPGPGFIDPLNGYAYFATISNPGKVVKIRLSDFTEVGSLTLDGQYPSSVLFDSAHGYAYFGTNSSPGEIIKVRLSDLTEVATLTVKAGENWLVAAAFLDPSGEFAYFEATSGQLVKIRLSDFTEVSSISLGGISFVDPINGLVYLKLGGDPGVISRVRLSDFAPMGTITLNAGEASLDAPLVDFANGYAYYGTFTYVPHVIKVDISPRICPPTISSMTPISGPTAGGTKVTITGTNLMTTTVTFGGAPAAIVSQSSTTMVVKSPAHAAGLTDVAVLTPDGQSVSSPSGFTYIAAPGSLLISPNSGSTVGGASVTITGTDFHGAIVKFDLSTAAITSQNSTTIVAVTPAHAKGIVDVVVTNSDGQKATLTGGYTYMTPPGFLSIVPSSGPTTGGTQVSIFGTDFNVAWVKFGTALAYIFSRYTTIMGVETPAQAAGSVDIVITNSDGQSVTVPNGFTYFEIVPTPPPPSPVPTPVAQEEGGFVSFKNVFNPEKESITISYTPPDGTIAVFDRQGVKVRDLSSGAQNGDVMQTMWDGRNADNQVVGSGTYILILRRGNKVFKKKVVVFK